MYRPGAYTSQPVAAAPLSRSEIEDACLGRVADCLDEMGDMFEKEWPSWRRFKVTGDQISGIPRTIVKAVRQQIGK